jgi:sugar lactone lactonase YvrE
MVSYGHGKFKIIYVNNGVVTTLAGAGGQGSADGTGTNASFNYPAGIAVLPNGNIVVADQWNHRIRIVTYPGGVVTTLAGTGGQGSADGTGTNASFYYPTGLAVLPNGNIIVADMYNNRIRLLTYPGGVVTTLAGNSNGAFADGTGTAASFHFPSDVSIDSNGNIVVADMINNCIRLVTTSSYALNSGVVTTIAGLGGGGNNFADGIGTNANFHWPQGVVVLSNGKIAVADTNNNRIRIVDPSSGAVTTLAGNSGSTFADGTGTSAIFNNPSQVDVDANGNIIVSDTSNSRIRLVTYPGGVVTTLGGASFSMPVAAIGIPSSGVIVVANFSGQNIRLIT